MLVTLVALVGQVAAADLVGQVAQRQEHSQTQVAQGNKAATVTAQAAAAVQQVQGQTDKVQRQLRSVAMVAQAKQQPILTQI